MLLSINQYLAEMSHTTLQFPLPFPSLHLPLLELISVTVFEIVQHSPELNPAC